ncbi:MAG: hypothetical protein IPI89_15440 [Propionivibrio sp.]|nr:hypothetical protein [Candidatus Propionivibrio aalborgensis]MBK7327429.1 hypothetical protein [Propionivibrio sp.]MBK7564612.1 hypothetical protein [Propionivibrio sp.]MBK9029533.1 hypothetical protein [Propionivibrio sp.]
MLYVDTARVFLNEGFVAAKETFSLPFLPIVMALFSKLTGFGLETSGYLLNALFLAGACALMTDCAGRKYPEAVWPICLVLLALPGLNHYRDEILREYGCWFFFMLTFWLSLRWSESPRWPMALLAQLALVLSALFRPEALTFFPALIMWQWFTSPKGEKLHRTLMIGGLPVLGLVAFAVLFLTGQLESGNRLVADFNRFNLVGFETKAQALSASLLPYARDQAKSILFFGSISIIPIKFVKQLGIFSVPLLFLFSTQSLRMTLTRWQPFTWAFFAHILVLVVFVLDLQFLAGRYVAVLSLLATPLVGYGLWLLMRRFPRWKHAMILLAGISLASNVVSLNPSKQHFVQAGSWLAQNASESPRVYIESPRAAYYAGWRFATRLGAQDRSLLPERIAQKQYDLAVLEVSRSEPDITPWLSSSGLREIQRFTETNGDAVIIAEPLSGRIQDNASKTGRMREKTGSTE